MRNFASISSRALYGAATEAGLPETERRNFANAYHKTNIHWTNHDPSPADNTRNIQSTDLKTGDTVRYSLSGAEQNSLKLRQTNYQLAGGKLGSNQDLPTVKEQVQAKNGVDQTALRRAQIEGALPNANAAPQTEAAAQTAPTKPFSEYQTDALKLIQKPGANPVTGANVDVRERNQAISGAYADLYLKNPEAFVWIGAAAYGSSQAGAAMDQAFAMPDTDNTIDPTGEFTAAAKVIGTPTGNIREMLGKGNIVIFQSIYPASLAYQQGGIAEMKRIENSLPPTSEEKTRFTAIRSAYETIDQGIQMNKQQPGSGDVRINEGTNAIVDFEQRVVLQPIFDEYTNTTRLVTPMVFSDLDADDTKTDDKTFSRFYTLKTDPLTRDTNHPLTTVTNLPMSYGDQDARVQWIKEEVMPKWDAQRMQRPDEAKRNLQTIIERGRQAGGQY